MSEQSRIAFERNVAIREANHIHDADAYFKARPQIDNADRRKVFEAGHCRAWNAATLESAERIAALESEIAELKELLSDRTQDLEFEYNRAEENFLSCGILQSEIDKLNEINEGINCPVCGSLAVSPKEIWYTKQIAALQASNNHLREALGQLITHTLECEKRLDEFHGLGDNAGSGCSDVICNSKQALSATPAESLQWHDDEVIERCAKVCEEINKYTQFQTVEDYKLANEAARNIRALKGK